MKNRHLFPLIILALFASYAFCQSGVQDPETVRLCAEAKNVEYPQGDRPTQAEVKALDGCVSEDLYFGFGQPADFTKARKCAYLEMDRGTGGVLGGRATLMMVYANGNGAERNFDVALRAACEIKATPGDTAGRVRNLARLKNAHWTGDGVLFCTYSSERSLYEQCALQQEKIDKIERDEKLNNITAKWNAQDKEKFQVLLDAADVFFKAHATKEADLDATIAVHEEAFLRDRFVSALGKFGNGELPNYSAEDARKAEAEMNTMYERIESAKDVHWGTATQASIKTAQQTWLTYRDAWITFGKDKYPSVSADSWKAWLNIQRVEMLEKFSM